MKTELKDVIHFYLGCKIQGQTHKEIAILKGVRSGVVYVSENNNAWADINDVKPLLRPLSDITEEEYEYLGFTTHAIHLIKSGQDEFTQFFTALEYAYLLKQGFDLFGLIESGQAIDKNSCNPLKE